MSVKLWIGLRRIMLIIIVWLIILLSMAVFELWRLYQEYPTMEYEWNTWEEPPKELQIKLAVLARARFLAIMILLASVLTEFLYYKQVYPNHWITPLINRVNESFK